MKLLLDTCIWGGQEDPEVEKIEIWEVGSGRTNESSLLTAIDSTGTEQVLEDILAGSPDMLERGLQLVGRQTLMTGGGYLDISISIGDRLVPWGATEDCTSKRMKRS